MKGKIYNLCSRLTACRKLLLVALFGLLSMTGRAQNTVSGTVVDGTGLPVIGASVLVSDSTIGTTTDIDGRYTLANVPAGATLEVSYIGYKTLTAAVNNRTTIDFVLEEDTQALDEVVVVGYGSMRKKDLTGSVVQINPDKIADSNPPTVQALLRGTPGLQIGYDASAKGGGSIQLRGQNSLYTDGSHNSPLIVLDGMVFYGELSEINPDDIGQIDVLKDASSAAIYGAKAASGVIIVTTKKGKQGKPVVSFSANFGVNTKAEYREVFKPADYLRYREDWYKATTYGVGADGKWGYYSTVSGVPVGYYDHYSRYNGSVEDWARSGSKTLSEGESYESLYARRIFPGDASQGVIDNYLAGKTWDWYNATFRTGFNQDYNVNMSGATDRINYYMSFGYLRNQGAVEGNDYHAIRSNLKLNAKVTDWFELGANVNFQDRSDGDVAVELGSNYWDNNMLRNSPFAPIRDANGNYVQFPMNASGASTNGGYNYWFERQYIDLEKGYTILNTIFNAKVTLPLGITYSFNIAPRYQWFHDRYFLSAERPYSSPSDRGVNRGWAKNFDYSLNNTLTWDKSFDKHHFTVTLVQEAEEQRYWSDTLHARNIQPSDALGLHYTTGANKEQSEFWTSDSHQTAAAYLGRLFYGYDDRYMLTATVRRDGYSAFGANNPWSTFWSLGGSWMFTNEKFVNLDWLDVGKLRFSYGTNGNRSLSDTYLSLANLGNGGSMVYGDGTVVNALTMSRLGNPNLEWEKTSAYNVGLDFGVLGNRITGSIEYYYKTTHDMIMAQRLPGFSGFGSITTNLGEVQNQGLEITLNTVNMDRQNFKWDMSVGFSYNKNRINHLYYDYDEKGVERDDTTNGWFIGRPIGEIWYWETDGIWQLDEADQAALVNQKPGDPKVVNHYTADDKILDDGTRVPVYNDNDRVFMGTTAPPIYWNMRHTFTLWKDLTLSFSLYSYMGHKSLSGNWLNQDNGGSMITNGYNVFAKEYWTPENPTNKYGRLDAQGPTGVSGINKLYNRSFVRFDNLSIGYTLPQKWTRKAMMERVRVTFGIDNLGTISGWEYGDPESGGLSVRTFNFGLNVTF